MQNPQIVAPDIDPRLLSGSDLLQAIIDGRLPPPSMLETMGMSDLVIGDGYAEFRARADGRHLNPMGGVHGGFAATVLDSVTGCAVHTKLEAGVSYGTVDLAVKMLRPVPAGTDLLAKARVTHISRSLGVAEAELLDPQGRLLASGSATCFIKRR
jgi:uncharacterized protein (TIGR00369 family)